MEFNDRRARHLTLSLNPTSVMLHAAFDGKGAAGSRKLISSMNLLEGATRPFLDFVQSKGQSLKMLLCAAFKGMDRLSLGLGTVRIRGHQQTQDTG